MFQRSLEVVEESRYDASAANGHPFKEGAMEKADLKDIIKLVKEKLSREPEAACGFFWPDNAEPTSLYSIGEEDNTMEYGVSERYAVWG